MGEEPRIRTMLERFLTLNHQAFATGHYAIAYHALAAALHTAQARQYAAGLAQVEALAQEQLATIDRTAPASEHSSHSAEARGHLSPFTLLAHEARAARRLLHPDTP